MKRTQASVQMKKLREGAARWDAEARILERVNDMNPAARVKSEEADRLRGEAEALRPENLAV